MRATLLLFVAAIAGASELAATAGSPSCTQGKIPAVIQSISASRPHPYLFCSAYNHVPKNIVTATATVTPASTTVTSVSTTTSTVYTDTSTTVAIVSTDACSTDTASLDKRATKTPAFKPSLVSSACSCIYPHTTGIATTITAATTTISQSTITVPSVTTTTVSTLSLETLTVYATGSLTPFYLEVTNYDASPGVTQANPDGDFVNYGPGTFAYATSPSTVADTEYIVDACNALVVVSLPDTYNNRIGSIASFDPTTTSDSSITFQLLPAAVQIQSSYVNSTCNVASDQLTCIDVANSGATFSTFFFEYDTFSIFEAGQAVHYNGGSVQLQTVPVA